MLNNLMHSVISALIYGKMALMMGGGGGPGKKHQLELKKVLSAIKKGQ